MSSKLILVSVLLLTACSDSEISQKEERHQFQPEEIIRFTKPSFACHTAQLYDQTLLHAVRKEKTKFESKFSNSDCVELPLDTDFKILSTHTGSGIYGIEVVNANNFKSANGMFSSSDNAVISAPITSRTNPNPVVSQVPISEIEKKYFEDAVCLDESACYGSRQFERDIYREYPDLKAKNAAIHKSGRINRDDFRNQFDATLHGMYFSKKIQLANGQTLFDFLATCSGAWDMNNRADFAFDDKQKQSFFSLQYFPKLRKSGDSQPIELNLVFDRRGNTVTPNSMAFSTHVLDSKDFLDKHGLKCWNN